MTTKDFIGGVPRRDVVNNRLSNVVGLVVKEDGTWGKVKEMRMPKAIPEDLEEIQYVPRMAQCIHNNYGFNQGRVQFIFCPLCGEKLE